MDDDESQYERACVIQPLRAENEVRLAHDFLFNLRLNDDDVAAEGKDVPIPTVERKESKRGKKRQQQQTMPIKPNKGAFVHDPDQANLLMMDGKETGKAYVPPQYWKAFLDCFAKDWVNGNRGFYSERFLDPEEKRRYIEDGDDPTTNGARKKDEVVKQVRARQEIVRQFFPDDDLSVCVCHVPEKDASYTDKKGLYHRVWSNSIHITFYWTVSNEIHSTTVVETEQIEMEKLFPCRAGEKPWTKRIDKGIHAGGLRLAGTHKSGKCPSCHNVREHRMNCEKCKGQGRLDLGRVYEPWFFLRDDGSEDEEKLRAVEFNKELALQYSCAHLVEIDGEGPPASSLSRFTIPEGAPRPAPLVRCKKAPEGLDGIDEYNYLMNPLDPSRDTNLFDADAKEMRKWKRGGNKRIVYAPTESKFDACKRLVQEHAYTPPHCNVYRNAVIREVSSNQHGTHFRVWTNSHWCACKYDYHHSNCVYFLIEKKTRTMTQQCTDSEEKWSQGADGKGVSMDCQTFNRMPNNPTTIKLDHVAPDLAEILFGPDKKNKKKATLRETKYNLGGSISVAERQRRQLEDGDKQMQYMVVRAQELRQQREAADAFNAREQQWIENHPTSQRQPSSTSSPNAMITQARQREAIPEFNRAVNHSLTHMHRQTPIKRSLEMANSGRIADESVPSDKRLRKVRILP